MKKIFTAAMLAALISFTSCELTINTGGDSSSSKQESSPEPNTFYTEEAETTAATVPPQSSQNIIDGTVPYDAVTEPPTTQPATAPNVVIVESGNGLSDSEQYEINIFLSNFSEQNFGYYNSTSWTPEQLIRFAHIYAKINKNDKITYTDRPMTPYPDIPLLNPYETMDISYVNDVIERYFGFRLSSSQTDNFIGDYNSGMGAYMSFADDDRFFFPAADGEMYDRFTVVETLDNIGGQLLAKYSVYEPSTFGDRLPSDCYKLTPKQARERADIYKTGSGTATVVPYNNGGRATYQLISYAPD